MVEDKAKAAQPTDATINESTVQSAAGDGPPVRRDVENTTRKITDYHLLRVIGTGTFGKVYLALLDGNPVALKALKKT
jgi:serine/threonine protein kinase